MFELRPLSEKQRRSVLEADARLNVWHGSVRSGKTVASIIAALDFIERGPSAPFLFVGKTERTLGRNILDVIVDLVGPQSARFSQGTGMGEVFGHKCYIAGANDARSEGKIRGMTLAGVYGDELTLWPESLFKMGLSRLSVPGARFFGTTNPDGPRHWLKRDFLDREGELDLRSFHFELADNETLPPEYIEAISREYTGLWRRRFVDGEWCVAEGLIWDGFDERHMLESLPDGVEIKEYVLGVDYGTANPFVALLIGRGSDGRFYVMDEWRWDSRKQHHQLTDAQYSRRVVDWLREEKGVWPSVWWVDPSAASFINQAARDGAPVAGADNSVEDGLRVVGTAFGKDRLFVLRCCSDLIDEIQSYGWDERAQERGEDKPIKQADHGPDALRYAIFALLGNEFDGPGGWIA